MLLFVINLYASTQDINIFISILILNYIIDKHLTRKLETFKYGIIIFKYGIIIYAYI